MSSITKEDVVNLREKTGAGLIDCKRALADSNGDMEEAISLLRKKGVASAAKKAGRDAGEGIIAQHLNADRSKGILVEVNCETDFVAKNEDFIAFSREVAQDLLGNPEIDLESKRTEQVAKIGENIRISRSESLAPSGNGVVESYVHTGAKVAVLIAISTESVLSEESNSKVLSLAKDLCMHIAATSPVCVSRDDIPSELVEKEKEIALAQAEGKPAQAIEKIVQGKLEKYFSTSCLLEQPFVKDPDHVIRDLLSSLGNEIGAEIGVERFIRFQVGEDS
ncbi:MAG TPA: translation elongation factor Ts [Opitutae bacterium]|jgi:elongation factor Ts|nr:translation elongation factor Ts [Verrucomicrobiota bacterium]HBJ61077.1 translation elongation factor Ts [Opitutae bacterium]|tara:strand:- start:2765 stop:3601 length:837 start_codon:yes stop_codon:yes gene_type:complete